MYSWEALLFGDTPLRHNSLSVPAVVTGCRSVLPASYDTISPSSAVLANVLEGLAKAQPLSTVQVACRGIYVGIVSHFSILSALACFPRAPPKLITKVQREKKSLYKSQVDSQMKKQYMRVQIINFRYCREHVNTRTISHLFHQTNQVKQLQDFFAFIAKHFPVHEKEEKSCFQGKEYF